MTKLSNGISRMKETFEAMKSKAVITPKKVLSILLSGLLACTLMLPSTQLAWADTPATDQNEQQGATDTGDVASASAGAPAVPDHSLDTAAFSGDYGTNAHWALYDSGEKTSDNKALYDLVISRKDPSKEASDDRSFPWSSKGGGKSYIRTVKVGTADEKVSFTNASSLFYGNTNTVAYDLSGMDTSRCVSFSDMFRANTSLTELDITPLTFNPDIMSNRGLTFMFYDSPALEKIEGLDNITQACWDKVDSTGGSVQWVFGNTSILSLDLSGLSNENANIFAYGILYHACATRVVLGEKLKVGNGGGLLEYSLASYWTPQGDADTKIKNTNDFKTYHEAHGYGKGDVTYVRWLQPTFNANGGTFDPSVDQGRKEQGEGLSANKGVYTGVAFQMYNGVDVDVDGKVKGDPSGYVSWGSRHFLGWFDTKDHANKATDAPDPKKAEGYIDLSEPATFQYLKPNRWDSNSGTVYAAWSKAQDVPVTDADGTTLPTTYVVSTGRASGSAKAVKMNPDLFKVADNPGYLTVTDETTGETVVGVKVTGSADDWKIQIPNNEAGYAPLRATVTPREETGDSMNDTATIKVTYPVMATVVDARGEAVPAAEGFSGDMDPETDGVQVLVDPQALAKDKDGKSSFTLQKGKDGKYAITIPDQGAKVPASVKVQKAIDKTPARAAEYTESNWTGVPGNTPFEEVWLDPSYLGRATLTVDVSDKDYTGDPVSFTAQSTSGNYEGTQNFTYYVKDDSVKEDQGAGAGWKKLDSAPTNAGTYKVVLTSTPNNPDEWASPEIQYNGPTDVNKQGEFVIKKVAVHFTKTELQGMQNGKIAYTGGPVALPEGWDVAVDNKWQSEDDNEKHKSDGTSSYEWQVKGQDGNYTKYGDGDQGSAPSTPGEYRLHRVINEGTNWNAATGDIDFTIEQAEAPAFTLSKVDSYTYNGATPGDPTFTQTNGSVAGTSGATATYTWQQKQGESYVDIPGNAKPTLPGDYRVVATITPGEGEQTPTITGDGWTPGENNTYTCDFSINKVTVHFTGKAQTKEWDNNHATFDVEALEEKSELSATLNFGEGGWKGGDPTPTVSLNKDVEWYASNGTDKLEGAPKAVGTYKVKVSWQAGEGWDAGSGFVDYEITKSADESATVTVNAGKFPYDGNSHAATSSVTDGTYDGLDKVTFSYQKWTGGDDGKGAPESWKGDGADEWGEATPDAPVNAGIYKVTATAPATGNAGAPKVTYTGQLGTNENSYAILIIDKATPDLSVTCDGWTAGGQAVTPTPKVANRDTIAFTDDEVAKITYTWQKKNDPSAQPSSDVPNDPGTYTLTAFYPGGDNWNSATASCEVTVGNHATYTIHYDANAPEGSVAQGTTPDQMVQIGKGDQVVQSNGYTIDGYTFVGWNTKPDGLGDTVKAGNDIPEAIAQQAGGEVTLYAQWEAKTDIDYKVEIYVQSEGKYPNEPTREVNLKGTTGQEVTVDPNDSHYLPEATEACSYAYDNENQGNVTGAVIKGDGSTTLKLYYKQQFSVTYAPGDHAAADSGEQKSGPLDWSRPTPPAPEYQPATGYKKADPAWSPELADTVTANATYTAQWEAISYKVVFVPSNDNRER